MIFDTKMLQVYLVGGTQDVHNDVVKFLEKVELAMKSGITAFQYREKGNSKLRPNERVDLGLELRTLCTHYGIPLIVDDDYELAQQINADGVHVGQNDTKIEQVSVAVGHQMFIGYSCNTPEQVERANTMDFIDYIGCGPVFPTKSKSDADTAIGINRLERLNMISERPVVAIGGIDEENMKVVHDTGVAGLAVISLVFDSKDLVATVKKMKNLYK
ncbi:thiamine phosphate synthase [Limosilactobacillus reuteri]|uniref:thiamine phosphate synthase n=1 Tax=Limosilactobacillus reuteri TaxID=1598 RepID=UPI001E2F3FAC|nr:thiamine phosphate synthase [Limosilactobacillus reuteri]MCC4349559.1 thiamine phosphate synthase [Limosilactobacillus reuteri]MCC4361147.1 thiamine phosphate synthase [Limosilactobacillus reuteri]MCC4379789.1 thiamine phosphate synthase [Limosilactobacillus reuteri]MCC4408234.1 thiamine phosphate synthase [Limosilactobacillus reuteri]MCC4416499.1 thiamine phosphate synthase [Limosilactobacillus reuteri]